MHLGTVNEEEINNMSYIFFEDVLAELGHKLTYDAIVNYAGNSFCEKSWDMIMKHNPFNISEGTQEDTALKGLASIFNSGNVKIGKPAMKHKK